MTFKAGNEYEWKKGGESPNPSGGLPKRVRRSKNRKLIEKMREHEDIALENIGRSVRGEDVDKECLQSSKWLCERLVSFSVACQNEEEKNANIKFKHQEAAQAEDEELEKEESTPKPARFQLTVVE